MTDGHRARSLLFLSCDIVGSTAYKQIDGQRWNRTFLSFYREFPQELGKQVKAAECGLAFELWKPIGDELLFTCEVASEQDVFDGVRIWLAAMSEYEAGTLIDEGLRTKGGAFIATFPGPDSECSIPRDPIIEVSDKDVELLNEEALDNRRHDRYLYDFFGPSLDTGFRITNAANDRYFTLSIEVVWAMQRCSVLAQNDDGRVRYQGLGDLAFLEMRSFKGVWKGRSYPLFAIDRLSDDPVNRAVNALQSSGCSPEAVASVCSACLSSPGWPSALFLPDSAFTPFRVVPVARHTAANEMVGAESPAIEPDGKDNLPDRPPLG